MSTTYKRVAMSPEELPRKIGAQEWDAMDVDSPHFYGTTGVLDINTLRSVERIVWERE